MSTNAAIIRRLDDELYEGILCYFDGHLPYRDLFFSDKVHPGVGLTLFRYYQDPEKVKKLIELGDISTLGEDLSKTIAYSRDREEPFQGNEPIRAPLAEVKSRLKEEKMNAASEDFYVYEGDRWFYEQYGDDDRRKPLQDLVEPYLVS